MAVDTFVKSYRLAPTSRELYRRTLLAFFSWVEETGRIIAELTAPDVVAYLDGLVMAGKSSLTVASYTNSIKSFYKWTEANRIYPNIAGTIRAPRRKKEFRKKPLTIPEVGKLLQYEQGQSLRDYAMINLMLRTGLRCIEVARANISDITIMGGCRVLMIQGKGREDKADFVKLHDAAYFPIRAYLDTRKGAPVNAPLFAGVSNHKGNAGRHAGDDSYNPQRLTTRSISRIAKGGLKNIGLNEHYYTAHSLRHTAGTNILMSGGTIEQAQFMLRHANPATTEIYTSTVRDIRRLENGGEDILNRIYAF